MQRVFEICFAAVAMVFGGVSLLTNQRFYRILVKPRFELRVFPVIRSRPIGARSFTETPDCLDDFETTVSAQSRAFMAGAASQAGDADSSRAAGLTSGLQGSKNVHRGALLLVPQ